MFQKIKEILGIGKKVEYAELIRDGAVIVDVRSKNEYAGGHIKGSVNIPVDMLSYNFNKLSIDKTIITCCASGMRSASAKNILKSKGFTSVYNGGSWISLQNKI